MMDEIKELKHIISQLQLFIVRHCGSPSSSSENIDQIAGALAEAQKEFTTPAMSQSILGEPYATVDDILAATAQACAKNGLKLYQHTDIIDEHTFIITKLIHSSGQYISTRHRLILGATDKEIGAHIEFHRRHQMMLLLGVGAKEQYDDVLETLQDFPEIAQEVMEKYGITTLADMPKAQFPEDIRHIRKLINQFSLGK